LNGLVRLIDGLTELEYIVSIIFTSQQEQKGGERNRGEGFFFHMLYVQFSVH